MKYLSIIFSITVLLGSCARTDLFEKNISFPKHQWDYANKPTISFDITDTVSYYNVFLVVRHTDAYHYNGQNRSKHEDECLSNIGPNHRPQSAHRRVGDGDET